MKNLIIAATLALMAIFSAYKASAQFNYNFSKTTQPYTALTSATSVSKNSLWRSDTTFIIPVGFNVKLAGKTTNTLYLSGGNGVSATPFGSPHSGFITTGAGLMDRGANWMTARSDIRYQTTGTTGSRIFKLEIHNAGFEDEFFTTGELKDSISLQFWVYEGSNIVEFRYGSSGVADFNQIFGSKMMTGFLQNADTFTGNFEKFYIANGTPTAPTLDSITSFTNMVGLSGVPPTGTVFRFTPKSTTGVSQVDPGTLATVYPTQCNGFLYVENRRSDVLSYTVINHLGRIVSQGNAGTGRTIIDLMGAVQGIYVLRLNDHANTTYEAQKFFRL